MSNFLLKSELPCFLGCTTESAGSREASGNHSPNIFLDVGSLLREELELVAGGDAAAGEGCEPVSRRHREEMGDRSHLHQHPLRRELQRERFQDGHLESEEPSEAGGRAEGVAQQAGLCSVQAAAAV